MVNDAISLRDENVRLQSALSDAQVETARLRSLLTDSQAMLPPDWKLTRAEEAIFRAMLANDIASPALLMEVTGTTADGARVHLHRLRKKMTDRRVEIETVNGRGWRLINRDQWASFLASPVTVDN